MTHNLELHYKGVKILYAMLYKHPSSSSTCLDEQKKYVLMLSFNVFCTLTELRSCVRIGVNFKQQN